ncbi:MAG: hypothetical protein ACT6R2_05325 [Blastomonas fulva]|jgi:hypothetical protein|uniref:hypothetical protein n=1 Tax=Alphaproteobacteria TaxID=28211 RepID=UPI0008554386|nr:MULTISPECIES: hypothetical protein [unclassified Blastomonas]AOG02722.1 hypothetical protein BSY18_3866 [Blastomonas sp. RAC04]
MASATKSRLRAVPTVEPALGWTYLSCDALARAKAQMDEESMGVRDEIGFLTIHQGYGFISDLSLLHTRCENASLDCPVEPQLLHARAVPISY